MRQKYVPYSAFATKTVFDIRRMGIIESGERCGQLEVHIGPRLNQVVLPGGRGFAIQGKVDSIGDWTRDVEGKYCLVDGFFEVFRFTCCVDAGEGMCLVLRPLGIGLGFRSLLASLGRGKKKLIKAVEKLRTITHARVNQFVGSKLQNRRGISMVLRERRRRDIVIPIDAWTVGEALAILDSKAEEIKSQGWRAHRGGYCDECGCNKSDACRSWEFHRDGERMSLYIRPTESEI